MAIRVRRKGRRQVDPSFPPLGPCLALEYGQVVSGELYLVFGQDVFLTGVPPVVLNPSTDAFACTSADISNPGEVHLEFGGETPAVGDVLFVPPGMTAIRGANGGLMCSGNYRMDDNL